MTTTDQTQQRTGRGTRAGKPAPVRPRRPPMRGWLGRGRGQSFYLQTPAEWRGTTMQVCGLWPFAVGALLGHLAIRGWRAPFRIWPHGLFVWAITLATGMAVRTLFGAGTEVSFLIVTAIVLAVGMLGWRAIALWLTRGERAAERRAAVEETPMGADETATDADRTADAG